MPFRSRRVPRTASGRVPQPQAGKQVGTAEAEEAEEAVAARVSVHHLYEKEFVIVVVSVNKGKKERLLRLLRLLKT